jgi:hypothetical protein
MSLMSSDIGFISYVLERNRQVSLHGTNNLTCHIMHNIASVHQPEGPTIQRELMHSVSDANKKMRK